MLFPQVELEEWSKLYGVLPKEGLCHACGDFIIANIPFADGPSRGLVSKDHGCGDRARLYVFVNKEKK